MTSVWCVRTDISCEETTYTMIPGPLNLVLVQMRATQQLDLIQTQAGRAFKHTHTHTAYYTAGRLFLTTLALLHVWCDTEQMASRALDGVWPGTGSSLLPLANRDKLAQAIHGHRVIDNPWHHKLQSQHVSPSLQEKANKEHREYNYTNTLIKQGKHLKGSISFNNTGRCEGTSLYLYTIPVSSFQYS